MEFLPIPELPVEEDRGRWNLLNALKDGLQKVVDAYWLTDNPWVYPYLLNSWQNYGEPYNLAGYRLDGNRLIHFTGVVKAGTPGITSVVFELPYTLRPDVTLRFPVATDSTTNPGHVEITKNGEVIIEDGSTTLTSLDGIIFRPE